MHVFLGSCLRFLHQGGCTVQQEQLSPQQASVTSDGKVKALEDALLCDL